MDESKNPRRVEAGRRNHQLKGPLTDDGRQRLREAALRNRPWLRSTGPKTQIGKLRSSRNGLQNRMVLPPTLSPIGVALLSILPALASERSQQILAIGGRQQVP